MKAIVQRVRGETNIKSCWDGQTEVLGFRGAGLVVLLGWMDSDETRADLEQAEAWIAERVLGLRVFPDSAGKMNLSLEDYLKTASPSEGGILWVPQFTLAGELSSGFRPSFTRAMSPPLARGRFEAFQNNLLSRALPFAMQFGRFGAEMDLSFTNWGPVTLALEK